MILYVSGLKMFIFQLGHKADPKLPNQEFVMNYDNMQLEESQTCVTTTIQKSQQQDLEQQQLVSIMTNLCSKETI